MIFVLKLKDFLRNKKKLVEPKDYIIFDATDDSSGELTKFANAVSLTRFKPPKALTRLTLKANESDFFEFDLDKIEKLEKNFLKGAEFLKSIDTIFVSAARKDQNIFVVMSDKDYKAYGERMIVELKKKSGDYDVVFGIKDVEDSPKVLRKMLSSGDISALKSAAEKLETKIRKLEEEEKDEDYHKKKKKKKKDKKKKKKDRWLDLY